MQDLDIPDTIAQCGVDARDYEKKLHLVAEKAFEDQTVVTNPRMPLIHELEEILRQAYGRELVQSDYSQTIPLDRGTRAAASPAGLRTIAMPQEQKNKRGPDSPPMFLLLF